jgi:hypothetical protein
MDAIAVDPNLAAAVAASYTAARSRPDDACVRAAYDQLISQTDQLFAQITRARARGVRVVFTYCATPYVTDTELIAAVRGERLLEVPTMSSSPSEQHPMLGNAVGGAYDRFRAVHDIVGHAMPQLGFDRDGEYTAWLIQDRLHTGLARLALATELHGKHSVRWTTGQVAEHKAVLLRPSLLHRSRVSPRAMHGRD